ncbi:MAG: hypothetical protein DMF62_03535 [Acidobacteria bacterium]|nr:MAG: hypothetical protein DMF62_03535 [Acidobacteriota bacterium]
MNERSQSTGLTKIVRDRGQYVLAFAVIASLLVVVNIPIFVVFFFGVFAYFLAKLISPGGGRMKTRSVFEFYLAAHEILRDDMRRWYGFEINDAIDRGERVLKEMHGAPTLVHFALGALYNKVGDHSAAVKHLSYVNENPESFESTVVYPSAELRGYVSVLRKIEREPSEAPLTSAAIRSLERRRKLKGDKLLDESRRIVEQLKAAEPEALPAAGTDSNGTADTRLTDNVDSNQNNGRRTPSTTPAEGTYLPAVFNEKTKNSAKDNEGSRKPITEVLHDIYDSNVN